MLAAWGVLEALLLPLALARRRCEQQRVRLSRADHISNTNKATMLLEIHGWSRKPTDRPPISIWIVEGWNIGHVSKQATAVAVLGTRRNQRRERGRWWNQPGLGSPKQPRIRPEKGRSDWLSPANGSRRPWRHHFWKAERTSRYDTDKSKACLYQHSSTDSTSQVKNDSRGKYPFLPNTARMRIFGAVRTKSETRSSVPPHITESIYQISRIQQRNLTSIPLIASSSFPE